MPLAQSQLSFFQEQGYLTVKDFFTPREVRAFQGELERLRQDNAFRNVATDKDGKTHSTQVANLQICPLYNKSSLSRALPFHPKVSETISSLIGDPVLLHLDQVFLKPARHGSGTSWHQDNAYFKIADPLKGTAMWVAVHDATVANGTIHVIPGMQLGKLEHSRDLGSDHHIRCYPAEHKAVAVELPAGGVVFFAYGVPHCTRANQTDRDRAGIAYHFVNQSVCTPEILSGPNRPIGTVLTGPQATGGLKEYGVRVGGTWEEELEKALDTARCGTGAPE